MERQKGVQKEGVRSGSARREMNRHGYRYLAVGLIAGALGTVALAVWLGGRRHDTTLTFQVRDTVSRAWVWDATIRLQNRTIRSYYQSDRGVRDLVFTHLKPGKFALTVGAPSYRSQSIPVTLKRGENRLARPVEMVGLEIPRLDHFIIFEKLQGQDVVCEIRPVGDDGHAVVNHPCMDLWIGARITVQMKDGLPARKPVTAGSTRGVELFRGKISWSWDSRPGTLFRYSARIPGDRIAPSDAPLRVIDYLIVIPRPEAVGPAEIDRIVASAFKSSRPEDLPGKLDTYRDTFSYYVFTSWNVRGAQ